MVTKEHIYEFIKKQKTAFVASVDEDGFPNIKAMFTLSISQPIHPLCAPDNLCKIQKPVFIFIIKAVFATRELCLLERQKFYRMQK